jgi:hypothetical protein
MLGFGLFAAVRNNEIRALILRGIYDVANIRIRRILFHNDLYNFESVFQRR